MTFGGPATEHHMIDAKDLAPAIYHLAEAVERASQIAAPDTDVRLNVRATGEGSFLVDFIIHTAWPGLVKFLTSADGNATVDLAVITGTLLGGIGLIKKKREHGGTPRIDNLDANQVEITYPDGTKFTANKFQVNFANDRKAAAATRAMLEPVERDGIDYLALATSSESITIEPQDLSVFGSGLTKDHDVISDTTILNTPLQFTDVTFRERGKWKLSDNEGRSFYAVVEDQEFLRRIDADEERFGKHDIIFVDLRVIYRLSPAGMLKADRIIEKVHRHVAPGDIQPILLQS